MGTKTNEYMRMMNALRALHKEILKNGKPPSAIKNIPETITDVIEKPSLTMAMVKCEARGNAKRSLVSVEWQFVGLGDDGLAQYLAVCPCCSEGMDQVKQAGVIEALGRVKNSKVQLPLEPVSGYLCDDCDEKQVALFEKYGQSKEKLELGKAMEAEQHYPT